MYEALEEQHYSSLKQCDQMYDNIRIAEERNMKLAGQNLIYRSQVKE